MHVCLLLAACGSSDPARDSDAITPISAAMPGPTVAAGRTSAPITGSHGGNIERIAVTDDGGAAITADASGLRLWPALDGSREPVVVRGAAPRALAISRDAGGFAIAVQDGAGGVTVIRLGARGEERGRAQLRAEPAIAQVEMTEHGALIVRADESIELVDGRGDVRARLVAEPGERIPALVTRAGKTLALIEKGGVVRGRWLEVADRLAWGTTTPVLSLDANAPVMMSPDHAQLAGKRGGKQLVVDIASGKPRGGVCGDLAEPQVLGFADAGTVACESIGQLVWWSVRSGQVPPVEKWTVGDAGVIADGRVIAGIGHQLALYAPHGVQYLGYGLRDLDAVRFTALGVMIGKGDQRALLLDEDLKTRARLALPEKPGGWRDLYPLDEHDVMVVEPQPLGQDAWSDTYTLSVYDVDAKAMRQVLPVHAWTPEIEYEAATQLLATTDGAKRMLMKWDPVARMFGKPIAIAAPVPMAGLFLVDPALADGAIAIGLHSDNAGTVVDELYAADTAGDRVAPRTSYRIPGEWVKADRAGHVYARPRVRQHDDALQIYRHGTFTGTIDGAAEARLYPSPDGAFVAVLAAPRVTLATTDGVVRWRAVAWEANELGWLAGDELVARFQGGLAQLDGATGAIADRQCGWAFGIADTPFQTSGSAANVCDVAP